MEQAHHERCYKTLPYAVVHAPQDFTIEVKEALKLLQHEHNTLFLLFLLMWRSVFRNVDFWPILVMHNMKTDTITIKFLLLMADTNN